MPVLKETKIMILRFLIVESLSCLKESDSLSEDETFVLGDETYKKCGAAGTQDRYIE